MLEKIRKHFAKKRRMAEIRAHLAANGGRFSFDGLSLELPATAPVKLQHSVISGHYEDSEIDLIKRHLPTDLPVVELGGCLGVVSAVIERKLGPGPEHLVVEAHPGLVGVCERNARSVGRKGRVGVVHGAVSYAGDTVRFEVSTNLHGNRIAEGDRRTSTVVPATTLSALLGRIDAAGGYALVCDIEGAEYDVFARDQDALAKCRMAIVEIHPDVFAARGQSEAEFLALAGKAGLRQLERIENVVLLVRA